MKSGKSLMKSSKSIKSTQRSIFLKKQEASKIETMLEDTK